LTIKKQNYIHRRLDTLNLLMVRSVCLIYCD